MSDKIKNSMEELFNISLIGEANYQLADPSLVSYWQDYSKRIVVLSPEVDETTMDQVYQIYRWNREDDENNIPVEERTPITILINSWGGDLNVCYAYIDAMKAFKGIVKTVNVGVACSASALIFISGTKGYRYCTKHSYTLLHQGMSTSSGTYSQQESAQKNYDRLIKMMTEIILEGSNYDVKSYKKIQEKENYFYAEDCIKNGLCDVIIESLSDI